MNKISKISNFNEDKSDLTSFQSPWLIDVINILLASWIVCVFRAFFTFPILGEIIVKDTITGSLAVDGFGWATDASACLSLLCIFSALAFTCSFIVSLIGRTYYAISFFLKSFGITLASLLFCVVNLVCFACFTFSFVINSSCFANTSPT